jgi:hypothetical protein
MSRLQKLKEKVKISPLNRRNDLLDMINSNIRANRQTTIQRLRNCEYDRIQVAADIIKHFPFELKSTVIENDSNIFTSHSNMEEIKDTFNDDDDDDDDDLTYYLGNEDYEFLLNGIMAELSEQMIYDENDTSIEYEDDDEGLLCPVCHVSTARIHHASETLICDCGFVFPLMGRCVSEFRETLAEKFESHRLWCCGQCPSLSNMVLFPLEFFIDEQSNLQARCAACSFQEVVV